MWQINEYIHFRILLLSLIDIKKMMDKKHGKCIPVNIKILTIHSQFLKDIFKLHKTIFENKLYKL